VRRNYLGGLACLIAAFYFSPHAYGNPLGIGAACEDYFKLAEGASGLALVCMPDVEKPWDTRPPLGTGLQTYWSAARAVDLDMLVEIGSACSEGDVGKWARSKDGYLAACMTGRYYNVPGPVLLDAPPFPVWALWSS